MCGAAVDRSVGNCGGGDASGYAYRVSSKRPKAKPVVEEKPTVMPGDPADSYSVADLIAASDSLLNVHSYVAAGALFGQAGPLTVGAAQTLVTSFLGADAPISQILTSALIGVPNGVLGLDSAGHSIVSQLSPLVERDAGAATSYTYNPDGSVATQVVDGASTVYAYNSDGSVRTVTRPSGLVETFSYNSDGTVSGSTVA